MPRVSLSLSFLLAACALSFATSVPAAAQSGGASVVLDGTLTFDGTLTLTIPPGYESLPPAPPASPPPVVTIAPAPAAVAPAAPLMAAVPEVRAATASVPYALPQAQTTARPTRYRRRWGMVIGGLALFLGGYALGVGVAANSSPSSLWPLLPIGGSLVQLDQEDDEWRVLTFVASAVAQTVGLVLCIVGTASRRPVRERPSSPTVGAVPVVAADGARLVLTGTF